MSTFEDVGSRGPHEAVPEWLLLHDDGEREFDYTTGAEQALEKADASGWTVVSIKNDWDTDLVA